MAFHAPRRKLDHTPPRWVDPSNALYFVTICCRPRGKNQLANNSVSQAIQSAIDHRVNRGLMYPYALLLMPDHLHVILGYNAATQSLAKVIASFKQRLAYDAGINWQKGFFDHRIRDESGYKEKIEYIKNNPVKAELVTTSDAWPYLWFANQRAISPGNDSSQIRLPAP